jgi:hypothetical protein
MHTARYIPFLQNKNWLKNLFLFAFCFAIIFGPAYAMFDTYNYDMVANPDLKTYLGLSHFDFDQSPIRKYRIIVPFLASGFNYVFHPLFSILAPKSFPGPNFSMCMSFMVINSIFMALFGMVVYRLCKAFGASTIGAIIGLLSALTCRWVSYIAGLPIVDSLYLLIMAMVLLGIKTNNSKLIIIAIFIGPWAKESFIFIAPLIFFFSSVSKKKQLVLFAISALLVFSFRYYFDRISNLPSNVGLQSDFSHFENITDSLKRLFSFHGLYEVFSIFGIWSFLFIFIIKKNVRKLLKQNTPFYLILFLGIVIIHALLSTELARMLYLAAPVLAIWISIISDSIIPFKLLKN